MVFLFIGEVGKKRTRCAAFYGEGVQGECPGGVSKEGMCRGCVSRGGVNPSAPEAEPAPCEQND